MAELGGTLPLARGRLLRIDRPLVMAILNATPDSFSDGGRLGTPQDVDEAIRKALGEGADILDVGGESTRPGHTPVPAQDEVRRILPVIASIRRIAPDAVVSIDTRKATVAAAALSAGADFVNDVSGLRDPEMPRVVREAGCALVWMRHADLAGADVLAACRDQMAEGLRRAQAAGIPSGRVILDPGLGFGDPPGGDAHANLALLRGIALYAHGRPVLIGASRKRFVGALTGQAEPSDRVAGSVAAAVEAVRAGAAIVRVHDVAATVTALGALARRAYET